MNELVRAIETALDITVSDRTRHAIRRALDNVGVDNRDDVAQQIFYECLRMRSNLNGPPHLVSDQQVRQATWRVWQNMYREAQRRRQRLSSLPADVPGPPHDSKMVQLREIISRLDHSDILIIQGIFDGQATAEVAERLGVSSHTIYRRLNKLINHLHSKLTED